MLILDIETEENLQCGVTSGGGGASGGGGGGGAVSTKSASGGVKLARAARASTATAIIEGTQAQGRAERAAGANAKAAGKIIRAAKSAGAAAKAAKAPTSTTRKRATPKIEQTVIAPPPANKSARTSKSERIERANNTMGAQAGRASRQESAASLAIKKARAEGNESEVKKQQDKYNRAVIRGYQIGKRSRQIARIASPD